MISIWKDGYKIKYKSAGLKRLDNIVVFIDGKGGFIERFCLHKEFWRVDCVFVNKKRRKLIILKDLMLGVCIRNLEGEEKIIELLELQVVVKIRR